MEGRSGISPGDSAPSTRYTVGISWSVLVLQSLCQSVALFANLSRQLVAELLQPLIDAGQFSSPFFLRDSQSSLQLFLGDFQTGQVQVFLGGNGAQDSGDLR